MIAVRIPPAEAGRISAGVKKEIPDLFAFTKILGEKSF
jgi:hypothetical protein